MQVISWSGVKRQAPPQLDIVAHRSSLVDLISLTLVLGPRRNPKTLIDGAQSHNTASSRLPSISLRHEKVAYNKRKKKYVARSPPVKCLMGLLRQPNWVIGARELPPQYIFDYSPSDCQPCSSSLNKKILVPSSIRPKTNRLIAQRLRRFKPRISRWWQQFN